MPENLQNKKDCTKYFFQTKKSRFESKNQTDIGTSFTNQRMITFRVTDTGIGISKVDQKSLFKLFGKLSSNHNRNKTGCGLGLTICKEIIEKLGGNITLSSEEGVGTTVEFNFPWKSAISH